jgi:hypothetical protein
MSRDFFTEEVVMFTRRFFICAVALLGGLLLGAALPPPAAADPGLCIGGITYGKWDLPPDPTAGGSASGVLVADNGNTPLYYFAAGLTEIGGPLSFRYGEIFGYLYDAGSPAAVPAYAVYGTWRGFQTGARGTWEAVIFDLKTGETVGEMDGGYRDPKPYKPGPRGKYSGSWYICERP